MPAWLILLIIVIIILIVWWTLRRNGKSYQPGFEVHAHEHEEHAEESHESAPDLKGAAPAEATVVEAAPAEEVLVEAAAEPAAEAVAAAPVEPEDFNIIEGIGPKINQVLHEAGIFTFAQLAAADVDSLKTILEPAGLRFIDPGSWAEQAGLVAEGKLEALQELQDKLKGGKRVE